VGRTLTLEVVPLGLPAPDRVSSHRAYGDFELVQAREMLLVVRVLVALISPDAYAKIAVFVSSAVYAFQPTTLRFIIWILQIPNVVRGACTSSRH
jgi:hypothetical protein